MRRVLFFLVLMMILCTESGYSQSIQLTGPDKAELVEGMTYRVSWLASGGETINVIIHGTRTPRGNVQRGEFVIPVAVGIPAAQGEFSFNLPWIDAIKFAIKLKEYDHTGRLVTSSEHEYSFRPAVLAKRLKDGIYLDLHKRIHQRLYVEKNGEITKVYFSSSSKNYDWLPSNDHISEPHDHAGVFKILEKTPSHWSALYHVQMRWSMRYLGGHFIHATTPIFYKVLGRPASGGCNRLTNSDAEDLYRATPVGTRVEIIGPAG